MLAYRQTGLPPPRAALFRINTESECGVVRWSLVEETLATTRGTDPDGFAMQVNGQQILVVGMARSGVAAAEFLAARGARVTLNDTKPESELQNAAALRDRG